MSLDTKQTQQYRKQYNHQHPQPKKPLKPQHYWGMLMAIPYGLAYGFLTFTLLNVAYELFLSQLLQAVFATVIPMSWLILPAVATGIVYWTIGQFELNAFIDSLSGKDSLLKKWSIKHTMLMLLGLLVAVFITIEFLEFLSAYLLVPVVLGSIAGMIHFTVFFMNANRSFDSLSSLFQTATAFSWQKLDDVLTFVSLAAPLLAIISVVFITGLFHYAVLALFSSGVLAVMAKKWRDPYYQKLDLFRRIYATIDATIREYTALIIHCIGEGAIPAAAANHTSTAFARFLGQSSGLVATANEYFCDLHAISGDEHHFVLYQNQVDKSLFICKVFEDDKAKHEDTEKTFYFKSTSDDCVNDAIKALHDQYNGTFKLIESKYNVQVKLTQPPALSYQEALLGAKVTFNQYFILLTTALLMGMALMAGLFAYQYITLPLLIVSFFGAGLVYRYMLQTKYPKLVVDEKKAPCCPPGSVQNNEEAHDHSHGLDYKPVVSALLCPNQYTTLSINRMLIMSLCMVLACTITMILPLSIMQCIVLGPVVYIALMQLYNVSTWSIWADKQTQCQDIHQTLSWLQNPMNWLKGMLFMLIAMVAVCIGINGGTEFISHLAIASPVMGPVIIGVFIFSAILTEGVWINDRLNQAFTQLALSPLRADNLTSSSDMSKPGAFACKKANKKVEVKIDEFNRFNSVALSAKQ